MNDTPAPWSRNRQALAVSLWVSFLAAAAGSVLLFGIIDPAAVTGLYGEPLFASRQAGYALAFFYLWMITLASSALTAYLVRTAPRRPRREP